MTPTSRAQVRASAVFTMLGVDMDVILCVILSLLSLEFEALKSEVIFLATEHTSDRPLRLVNLLGLLPLRFVEFLRYIRLRAFVDIISTNDLPLQHIDNTSHRVNHLVAITIRTA